MSLAHTDADIDRTINLAGTAATNAAREPTRFTGGFVVGHVLLAHVVHEEHRAGDDEHHHGEEHEREMPPVPSFPPSTSCCAARGRSEHAERGEGGDREGRTGDEGHAA